MSNTHVAFADAQKARDTTLNDEKFNCFHDTYIGRAVPIDKTCVVVTALCNQSKGFFSDLGDDQSSYL